jgi:hypothetical protein
LNGAVDHRLDLRCVPDVNRGGNRFAPGASNGVDDGLCTIVAYVGNEDGRTLARKQDRAGPSHARPAAGHDRDFPRHSAKHHGSIIWQVLLAVVT